VGLDPRADQSHWPGVEAGRSRYPCPLLGRGVDTELADQLAGASAQRFAQHQRPSASPALGDAPLPGESVFVASLRASSRGVWVYESGHRFFLSLFLSCAVCSRGRPDDLPVRRVGPVLRCSASLIVEGRWSGHLPTLQAARWSWTRQRQPPEWVQQEQRPSHKEAGRTCCASQETRDLAGGSGVRSRPRKGERRSCGNASRDRLSAPRRG